MRHLAETGVEQAESLPTAKGLKEQMDDLKARVKAANSKKKRTLSKNLPSASL